MKLLIIVLETSAIFGYIAYRIYKYLNKDSLQNKFDSLQQKADSLETEITGLRKQNEKVNNTTITNDGTMPGGKPVKSIDDL